MYKVFVEFLGTLAALSALAFTGNPVMFLGVLAIAIGLGGKISGGHFNPAISAWAYLSGKLSGTDAGWYVAAQLAAAALVTVLSVSA
jgi:glycerol uptake facilitator-like aquaporin